MTSPLHPSVRASWCAFNEPFEARVPWLYLDSHKPPIATCGIGCAVVSLEAMLELPWQLPDGSPAPTRAKFVDWYRVNRLPGGMLAGRYRDAGGQFLTLSDDSIEALALERYDAIAAAILARWPNAASWPDEAWQAVASMAYALGTSSTARPGLLSPEWPLLHAALDACDWETAARECVMRGAGLDRRNAANVALFRAAAGT